MECAKIMCVTRNMNITWSRLSNGVMIARLKCMELIFKVDKWSTAITGHFLNLISDLQMTGCNIERCYKLP